MNVLKLDGNDIDFIVCTGDKLMINAPKIEDFNEQNYAGIRT